MGIWSPETLPAPLVILREQRDHLLLVSDWTQAADSPLSTSKKAEWATYRQTLRDLPNTLAARGSFVSEANTNPLDSTNGEWSWPARPS